MISVVIPSYNRRDGMLALLADVYRQRHADFEVVVVDDCSLDDSVEAICREFPQVRLFVNERNSGPAVTRNHGIREAKGELIVGFDSDVTLPDDTLLAEVEACFRTDDPSLQGIALRVLMPDGVSDDVARWWHPLPAAEFADKSFATSYFSGTAYAFRREAVLAAGMFPELLYMHYEEVELAWRILDQGGRMLHTPGLAVVHHANPVSRRSEIEVFYKPRNQILLAVSCLPLGRALYYLAPRTFYQGCKALTRGHFKRFLQALHSAISLMPRQFQTRRPLQNRTLKLLKDLRQTPATTTAAHLR